MGRSLEGVELETCCRTGESETTTFYMVKGITDVFVTSREKDE
jgi:hypothetical protein